MNERIEQLWCQGTHAVMPKSNGYASVSAEEIKKFAELIVRECSKTIEDVHSKDLGDYLKEVFGVEE